MTGTPALLRRTGADARAAGDPRSAGLMGVWLGVIWATAGLLCLVGRFLPGAEQRHPVLVLTLGFAAVAVAACCLLGRHRIGVGLAEPLVGGLALALAVSVQAVGPNVGVWAPVTFSYAVTLFAAVFLPRRAAGRTMLLTAGLLGVALAMHGRLEMATIWVLVMLPNAIVSYIVASLTERLRLMSLTDPLTGLPNRRVFDHMVPLLTATARRTSRPLTVVSIDLDGLKLVNDRQGHHAGDALLVAAAQGWSRVVRGSDLLVRTGGDEFALVLPDTDEPGAQRLLARMREAAPTVQWSAGVKAWDGDGDPDELLREADRLMYDAKRAGRAGAGDTAL